MKSAWVASVLAIAGCDGDPWPNITPTAYPDTISTRPMTPIDIDVLSNDGDPDGGASNLTIELATQPANATATVVANRVRVVPRPGFIGRVTFAYRARDAAGAASNDATVTVDVAPLMRALLVTYSSVSPLERWTVADVRGEWPVASHMATCGNRSYPVRNPSGTQVVIMTCGGEPLRRSLMSVRARESAVWSREIAFDLQLHGNMVLSDDGSRVVVLQYEEDPNTVSGVSNFQLLAIDTTSGAVLRRLPITGVEMIYGLQGAGPARKIYLQVQDNSSGVLHPAILTADLDAGTVARLDTANPYNVLTQDSMPYANGDGLLFTYADQRLYALDSLTPAELRIPWEDPDAYLYPRAIIPGSASAIVVRYDFSSSVSQPEFWNVPLRNPGARRLVVQNVPGLSTYMAMKPDGRRMLIASAPLPSLHTFVKEVSTENDASFGAVGPDSGIQLLNEFEYLGPNGDVLVSTGDPDTYERVSIIRNAQRNVLVPLATDLDHFGVIYRAADVEGTGVAFSLRLVGGTGRFRAYVADVNLPGTSIPLGAPRTDDEEVYAYAALGAPLP